MREILKLGGKLFAIALVAALVLGFTNAITSGPIAEQQVIAADKARKEVLSTAQTFEIVPGDKIPEGIDEIYIGYGSGNEVCGYTGKITVKGYGGPVEVTVGVDSKGVITGVSAGGSDFAETAGLGAKVKDPAFRDGFKGLGAAAPDEIAVKQDGGKVDAVTSATRSSRAVANGVRTVVNCLKDNFLTEGN